MFFARWASFLLMSKDFRASTVCEVRAIAWTT